MMISIIIRVKFASYELAAFKYIFKYNIITYNIGHFLLINVCMNLQLYNEYFLQKIYSLI